MKNKLQFDLSIFIVKTKLFLKEKYYGLLILPNILEKVELQSQGRKAANKGLKCILIIKINKSE